MKSILFRRSPHVSTVLILLLALFVQPVAADTTVGGTISTDTTWTLENSPYIVTSNITVQGTDGDDSITTLTIEPGVVVKFNSSRRMYIGASSGDPGALSAVGTSAEPIVFTSNQADPAAGDWYYICFYNTTDDATTVMEHCVVEYGGAGNGALYAYQASPSFNYVTVQNSGNYGAYLYTAEPTIENCTFTGNENYDLFYTGMVGGSVTDSTLNSGISLLATGTVSFSGNTINQNNDFPIKAYADNVGGIVSGSTIGNVDTDSYLEVSADTIEHDATWTAAIPYAITGNITVQGTDGDDEITTLTIEPGAELRFNSSRRMYIGASSGDPGALSAVGTSAEPIVFTSNQADPAAGDWNYIRFYNTTDDATTVMEHCVVQYGGASAGALYAYQASPTFNYVTVQNSGNYGAYLYTAEPTIENCTFTGNQNYDLFYTGTVGGSVTNSTLNSGISLLATGTVSFSGNTINQNNDFPIKAYADNVGDIVDDNTFTNVDSSSCLEASADTIEQDATWTAAIPYVITGNITVQGTDGDDEITTLTIDPGATLKFNSSRNMTIGASSGDPGALIAQGTSDNMILFTSNQASPAAGDWNYIRFYTTTDDATTLMAYCVVDYGGSSGGALYLYNAAPTIQNSTIRNSNTAGIYATGSGSVTASINCNTFTANQNGIYWTVSPAPEMHSNNFTGNTNYGIYYSGSETLDAEDNWWGDSAGPNQSGDATYGNVDADPWSTEENDCTGTVENQVPNEPSDPTPADADVRVAIDDGVTLSWTGGDPNPLDTVTYDLYWGTASDSLQLAVADLSQATYTQASASQGLTYYWQIIARDNNAAETTGPVWQFTTDGDSPDLIVSQVTTDPAGNLQSGQSVTFTATIQNAGSGPVVDAFSVDFQVDTVSIDTVSIDQILLAGESLQISQTWTYTSGDPTITVIADDQEQVTETDETNNNFNATLFSLVDNSAPVLTNASPADGDYLQTIEQITATLVDALGTVDDAAVMASFAVIDSDQQNISGTVTEAENTFTFVPASLPLADDTYTVSLTAADTSGNTQDYAFSFTIDTQPPGKPIITGGTVDSGTIEPQPTQNTSSQFVIELTGSREAGTSVWINQVQKTDIGDNSWTAELILHSGSNVFEIQLQDRAGNQGEAETVSIQMQIKSSQQYNYNQSGRLDGIDN